MQIEIKVPDLGDYHDVKVIDLPIKAGDRIRVDQTLLTIETDKASMDVPATHAGVVKDVKIKVGEKVSEGTVVLLLDAVEGAPAAKPAAKAASAPSAPAPAKPTPAARPATTQGSPSPVINEASFRLAFASPSVRKFARELGADLGRVRGSGPKGRILEEDVKAWVKGMLAAPPSSGLDLLPWPKIDFTKFGAVESRPLSRIKKIGGANLARNWVLIPHVTQFEEADITDLEALRKKLSEDLKKKDVKLTLLAFLVKATVEALKAFPDFNASLDGENLVLKKYFHIGFAADTPQGLTVPVIRDADKKSLVEIAVELAALAGKARDGKLQGADIQGGCFTISSLGGIGGTAFTPIINAPEVAILGASRASMKPVWDGKAFAPRLMLPLSLSYDHRVIDGAAGARFTGELVKALGDGKRLAGGA
jgi:pyruvate dehydrogenase E2 component (dihydrolipoamide acetyltransferase)